MIPQFTDEGLLPSGVYETDLEELKEKYGEPRRRRIIPDQADSALQDLPGKRLRQQQRPEKSRF